MNNAAQERFKKIDELRKELANFKNIDHACKILCKFENENEKVIYNHRSGVYRYANYYIIPGFRPEDCTFINNLRFITRFGYCKTSAPELITYLQAKKDLFAVIIYKLNNTRGGQLHSVYLLSDIPNGKMTKFIQEQIDLLEGTGIYNNCIINNNFDYWYLTPYTKNVFIDNWGELRRCKNTAEKEKIKELLCGMLKL